MQPHFPQKSALLLAALVGLPGAACKSEDERCRDAVTPATAAWDAYLSGLREASTAAETKKGHAAKQLEGVEKRIDDEARAKASGLTREGETAWYRTYNAARQSLCSDDATCSALKGELLHSDTVIEEMAGRIAATETLLAALRGAPEARPSELPTVEDDFDRRDLLAAARTASAEVPDACPPKKAK